MRILLRCAASAALVTLAACSGGSGGSTDAAGPSSAMSDAEILKVGKQLAQCYRDNGVPSLPDPIVKNSRLVLPDRALERLDEQYSEQVLAQSRQACQTIAGKLPQSALQSEEDVETVGPEDVNALRTYAKCMRDNGIPEWPDPKADGSFPLRGTALQKERDSPRLTSARQACRQLWANNIRIS
jgi:hypothetical protein